MKNKIYPKDIEEIVGNGVVLEEFFRYAADAINMMKPDERIEALKGLDFLNRMNVSLWALHEDYKHRDKASVGFEWDAFVLGCADKLYPAIKRLPLDFNDYTLSAYSLGNKLGDYAQASSEFRNLIEQNMSQAKRVFIGGTEIPALLDDSSASLRNSLGSYITSDNINSKFFGMVVDEDGVTPIKFACSTYGIGLEHAIDIDAWKNMGKPPYVESVAQNIPHLISRARQYPETSLDEWREGYCNTLKFYRVINTHGEKIYVLSPFDANSNHFERTPFTFDMETKKLIPYEKSFEDSPQIKFANETQKQRLTELVNEAVNDCEPLRCYLENGGIIPAEEVKPEWITNTYGPNKSASKSVEMSEPFMN